MRWLKLGAIGAFFTGILSVIQGCSEREGALFAFLLFFLGFCSGPQDSDGDPGSGPVACTIDLANGLVAEWKFDEGSPSTTAIDSTGNGHTGTLQNGASYGTGVSGTALLLDGSNDYVTVPDADALDFSTFTFEGWFNITSLTSLNQGIINKYRTDVPTEGGYQIYIRSSDGSIEADIKDNAGNRNGGLTPSSAGVWQHFALTFDANVANLYVNGVLKDTNTGVVTITPNNLPLLIGALRDLNSVVHRFFGGRIDELRLYNRTLCTDEVIARCELNNPSGISCG